MSYCSFCGKQLKDDEKCTCPGAANEQKNNAGAKNIKKIVIPAAIALVLVVAVICIISYIKTGVDLEDYIQIDGVTGLNGQGELHYSLDEAALYAVLAGKDNSEKMNNENFEELFSESIEKYEMATDMISCIQLMPSKTTGLSNGDKVTLEAIFLNAENQTFTHHFKDASISYTVSGLEEGKAIDPFADNVVTVSFAGFSGQGEAEIVVTSTEEIYQQFTYSLSPLAGLSNGDTVTLSVKFDSAELESFGYFAPTQTEKNFFVTGLQEYFKLSDGFPDDLLDVLCKDALQRTQKKHEEWIIDMGYASVIEPEIICTYFLEVSDPSQPYKDYFNWIEFSNAVMVMTHHTTQGTGFISDMKHDMYRTYIYPNFAVDSEGNITYDSDVVGGFNYSYTGSAEATLEAQKAEYRDVKFTEIK